MHQNLTISFHVTHSCLSKVRKQLSRSKVKVRCHWNLITSRLYRITY